MSRSRLAARWQGVALTFVIGAATIWLAATGQLVLYIHPRYVVFTMMMVAIGMLLALLALATGGEQDHGHADTVAAPPRHGPARSTLTLAGVAVTVGIGAALILLPPTTLTSATASTRGLGDDTGVVGPAAGTAVDTSAADSATAKYSVLQWANTLRETSNLSFYENKRVDVTGFISPSTTDPADTFFVTRFVITCCAVDAQPVGVTVYSPNWQSSFHADEWVRITGSFTTDPSRTNPASIALVPLALTEVARPADPYLT